MLPSADGWFAWLAVAALVAFACGLRPFASAFWLALAAWLDLLTLPAGLMLLNHTSVLLLCAGLALAERVADTLALRGRDEDLLLASLRVPMGAMLCAAFLLELLGAWGWLGLPAGAALAASGQALKAALRALLALLAWSWPRRGLPVLLDALVPLAIALAWLRPGLALLMLGLTLLVALPAAIWWARELRSRYRRWAALHADPQA